MNKKLIFDITLSILAAIATLFTLAVCAIAVFANIEMWIKITCFVVWTICFIAATVVLTLFSMTYPNKTK